MGLIPLHCMFFLVCSPVTSAVTQYHRRHLLGSCIYDQDPLTHQEINQHVHIIVLTRVLHMQRLVLLSRWVYATPSSKRKFIWRKKVNVYTSCYGNCNRGQEEPDEARR
ncbi:hypothetical protein BCR43DRAFT_563860 [Syncephalastrum racemosum]|uniref:Secreted protein n=1 Tax=Syncephalastrum racemosum TaxID=13706 RepID=A0A1X2HCR9_SYNRA|nr:hypothetical protein BCR43DRAFT_563860 [Syncephalastrum racemosum]